MSKMIIARAYWNFDRVVLVIYDDNSVELTIGPGAVETIEDIQKMSKWLANATDPYTNATPQIALW